MKKLLILLSFVLLLLIGCGEVSKNDISKEKPLPAEIKGNDSGANKDNGVDMDGNGIIDKVLLDCPKGGHDFTLTINGASITGRGDNLDGYYRIVDINTNDNRKEIAISESGPSGDPQTAFYFYNGEGPVFMGKIEGANNEIKINGDGRIIARTRAQVLQTWWYAEPFKLNEEHLLERVPQDFYNSVYDSKVKVIKSLPLQKSPADANAAIILQPGEEVNILGTDDREWCLVETAKGVKGWFAVEKYDQLKGTNQSASEFFEGLSYAD